MKPLRSQLSFGPFPLHTFKKSDLRMGFTSLNTFVNLSQKVIALCGCTTEKMTGCFLFKLILIKVVFTLSSVDLVRTRIENVTFSQCLFSVHTGILR